MNISMEVVANAAQTVTKPGTPSADGKPTPPTREQVSKIILQGEGCQFVFTASYEDGKAFQLGDWKTVTIN